MKNLIMKLFIISILFLYNKVCLSRGRDQSYYVNRWRDQAMFHNHLLSRPTTSTTNHPRNVDLKQSQLTSNYNSSLNHREVQSTNLNQISSPLIPTHTTHEPLKQSTQQQITKGNSKFVTGRRKNFIQPNEREARRKYF